MGDTIRTPDPAENPRKVVNPPTSWIESKHEPLPHEPTIMAPASVEEFPVEVQPFVLDPHRQINQYILVKVLGKGGMGEVWKAWDRKLSRWAAIKFLLGESQEGVLRFKREAKMAARLSHPNIAPVHEVGEAPSRQPGQPTCHFLAMEYIDGATLGAAQLSMRDRIDVFVKVAQGIEAAHKGGVVHRDIKPANVMLTKDHWPYVMDFGLAKSLDGDNNLSATGAVMGTPAFMPPEQVEGRLEEIGPWSDVYSLGATMYSVFCGVHPFTAQTTLQLLQKVVNEAPPAPRQRNPEIAPELESIILKAMAKKKEDRFATAGAVADALRRILARIDAAADAPAPIPVPPTAPAPKTKSAWPVVAALFLIMIGTTGLGALWWFKFRKPTAPATPLAAVDPKPEPPPENKTRPTGFTPEVKPESKPDGKPEPVKVVVPPAAEQVIQRGFDSLAARVRQAALSSDSDYWAAYVLMLAPTAVPRERLVEFLRSGAWQMSSRATTAAAARALALAASGDPKLQELTAECAQFLVETQGPNGLWAESTEASVRAEAPAQAEGSAFILSGDPARKRVEIVKKGSAAKAPEGDLLTTHLAILALTAAENCGHRVPADTWTRALQAVDAAWLPEADGATNAACIVSSVLCRQALGDLEAAKTPRVQAAARLLGTVKELPLSLLVSMERAAAVLSTPRLGDLEWYGAGARALAATQQPDGSWLEGRDAVAGTAKALAFLTRATGALKGKRGGAGRLEMKSLGGCTNLMFVLDASGNMRQELGDRERFDVAKETIAKVVEQMPEGAIAGLRVFGNRRLAVEPGAEVDTTLVAPPGPVNRRQMVTHLQGLKVRGRSPLTFTLIQTAADVSMVPADVEMAVVLVIDGRDMEPRADPVPATGDLAASRRGLKVHVVGFNTDDDIHERLRRMADAGGGRYFPARNEKELVAQLTAATVGIQDYTVLNSKGEAVAKGRLGDSRELPEGRYTVVVGGQQEKIWVHPGQLTRVIVQQDKLAPVKQ